MYQTIAAARRWLANGSPSSWAWTAAPETILVLIRLSYQGGLEAFERDLRAGTALTRVDGSVI